MKNTICTDLRMYLIKFSWTLTRGQFITTDLAGCVKENQPKDRGIEYIKTFDPSTGKFKRISKKDILKFHSFDTEALETLKNHPFFK